MLKAKGAIPDRRVLPLAGEEKIRSGRNRLVRTERAKCGCVRGGFWRGNLDQLGASQLSAVRKILHARQGIADAKYSRLSGYRRRDPLTSAN